MPSWQSNCQYPRQGIVSNPSWSVVFGQCSQLWWDLPLSDSFDLHRRIYDIPPARLRENLERFSAMLDLTSFLDRAVLQLSLGQRSSEFHWPRGPGIRF